MEKVLVTGIAGLIGSNLAKRLIKEGYTVVGIDDLSGGYKDNIPNNCKFFKADINNIEVVKQAVKGCNIVFHAACFPHEGVSTFSPSLITKSVYSGTLAVLSAAISEGVDFFINCSSMARYGDTKLPFTEYSDCNPVDPYGLAKLQVEKQIHLLHLTYKFNYVTIVPHNVCGIGQIYSDPYRNVVGIMINKALKGENLVIYGDGNQKRSFSDVLDCVEAIMAIIKYEHRSRLCCRVYNIGPDKNEITINELAQRILKKVDSNKSINYQPDRPNEVKEAFCSSERIQTDFNIKNKITLNETLDNMINWIRRRGVQDFSYRLPLEIVNDSTPKTWTNKII